MIWNRSLLAVEALTVAEHSEKYFDLWQRLFDRQTRNGWTTAQIAEIFRELKIDTTDLAKRLEAAEAAAIARRKQLAAAGISGVPAVYIGKNRVWALNQTEQCVVRLFDRVAPVSGASPRTP
jgi:protein-disulfide isomerase